MENFKDNSIEKGGDVTIHAVFTRHGEKEYVPGNSETGLTEAGRKKSLELGRGREEVDLIKPYSSQTLRSKETAELETAGSPTANKGEYRPRKELGFQFDPNSDFVKEINRISREIIGDNRAEKDPELFNRLMGQAAAAQTDYYLSFSDKKPDAIAPSPKEAAAGIAKMVDNYLRMTERLNSGSVLDLINATHDLNLSAFLKEVLVSEVDGNRIVGFNSINDIGGTFGYNERFEVLIKTDSVGVESHRLLFRGQEFEIDKKKFQELVNKK